MERIRCHESQKFHYRRHVGLRGGQGRYPFSIRNLHANAVYWDGHDGTIDYAPEFIRREPQRHGQIPENALSLGFRVEYGNFAAYFGGDIDDPDYEKRLAPIIGRVDVCKMNHHGCPTSMGADLCRALQAKLYVSCVWSPNQITERNLVNMTSRDLYAGTRYICPGFLPDVKRKEYEGRPFLRDFLPHQGHTVVKVSEGGRSWEFFVLTTEDESLEILEHHHS